MNQRVVLIPFTVSSAISEQQIIAALQAILDVGIADAKKTVETAEHGGPELAQHAAALEIGELVVVSGESPVQAAPGVPEGFQAFDVHGHVYVQREIPGPDDGALYRVPIAVDNSMSCVVLVRAAKRDEAVERARELVSSGGAPLEVDEGNYRGFCDHYCPDNSSDAVYRLPLAGLSRVAEGTVPSEPAHEEFAFLPQSGVVEKLLKAGVAALQYLPQQVKQDLVAAMREFEHFACPTLWSTGDVDLNDDHGLTSEEKREVIARFVRSYECKNGDWDALERHAQDVHTERSRAAGSASPKAPDATQAGYFDVDAYPTMDAWFGFGKETSVDSFDTFEEAKAFAMSERFNDYYQVAVIAVGEHEDHEPGERIFLRFNRD